MDEKQTEICCFYLYPQRHFCERWGCYINWQTFSAVAFLLENQNFIVIRAFSFCVVYLSVFTVSRLSWGGWYLILDLDTARVGVGCGVCVIHYSLGRLTWGGGLLLHSDALWLRNWRWRGAPPCPFKRHHHSHTCQPKFETLPPCPSRLLAFFCSSLK